MGDRKKWVALVLHNIDDAAPAETLHALWDANNLSEGEYIDRLLPLLTSSNINAVAERLPARIFSALRDYLSDAKLAALERVAAAARDCGDSACRFAQRPLRGMRTNGGCQCRERILDALADLDKIEPLTENLNLEYWRQEHDR